MRKTILSKRRQLNLMVHTNTYRCPLQHRVQNRIPKLTDPHSGYFALQSMQLLLPGSLHIIFQSSGSISVRATVLSAATGTDVDEVASEQVVSVAVETGEAVMGIRLLVSRSKVTLLPWLWLLLAEATDFDVVDRSIIMVRRQKILLRFCCDGNGTVTSVGIVFALSASASNTTQSVQICCFLILVIDTIALLFVG